AAGREGTEVAALPAEGAGRRWAQLRHRLRIGLPGPESGKEAGTAPGSAPGNTSASSHAGTGDA
ncbi:SGNH/GDSL hydrolase family protein, partial [Kitasatospora sp. NPDC004799]